MSTSVFRSRQFKSKKDIKIINISPPMLPVSMPPASGLPSPVTPEPKTHKFIVNPATKIITSYPSKPSLSSKSSYSESTKSSISSAKSSVYSSDSTCTNSQFNEIEATIILMVKYEFTGENSQELSCKANDYVKLLDRPGDGWISVKNIITGDKGLIPASYVNIAVNDLISPITSDWLKQIVSSETDCETCDTTIATTESEDMFEFEKLPYPQAITVSTVLESNERFWYRIDIVLNNTDSVYISKFYQDFYNLHIQLSDLGHPGLPKLPDPIKTSTVDKKYYETLLLRCNQLNSYLNQLLRVRTFQRSHEFYEWISNSNKLVNPESKSNEYINNQLYTNSVDLYNLLSPRTYSPATAFSPTPPLPQEGFKTTKAQAMVESHSSQSLSSLIDNYKGEDSTLASSPNNSVNQPMVFSPSNSELDSIFSNPATPHVSHEFDLMSTPPTPISPLFHNKRVMSEFVKIKVYLNNVENDIIVVKVNNAHLQSITDLKKKISYKIYKDSDLINHYKLEATVNKDMSEEELMNYVKSNAKVHLKLVRLRGSM